MTYVLSHHLKNIHREHQRIKHYPEQRGRGIKRKHFPIQYGRRVEKDTEKGPDSVKSDDQIWKI